MEMQGETEVDVFVVGGGINGVGIARDAVGRGYSTYLAEMDDLAGNLPEKVAEFEALWNAWAKENQVTPLPRDLGVGYLKPD